MLRLPAIGDAEITIPIGPGQFYHRAVREILHRAREPLGVFEGLRRALGSTNFPAPNQQCLVLADGEIVRWGWFQRYAGPPVASQMVIHQSWDTASEADDHHDYSGCSTWRAVGDKL